ncbi:hypothetical protein llap_14677 [Limosa lapponica baueri]|uniref:Interleukin n=1 Tax=Limosa lapponica baueri TaxID=1758121 RepID=A0A2I0TMJ0_LIMLA|nr:hypothetical protein llap_14677 [Limosa lapponica baueri]
MAYGRGTVEWQEWIAHVGKNQRRQILNGAGPVLAELLKISSFTNRADLAWHLGEYLPKPNFVSCSKRDNKKTHLKSICLQYQLYLLLNSHFFCLLKNEKGLIIFFLCAYVPKTAAGHCKWAEVLKDLERIKTSKDIDVSLYTANTDEDKECREPVIRCFVLETEVILHECRIKNCSKTQDVYNIWKNGNASLENNKLSSTRSAKCKECEEYEEKNFTEFIQSFVKVIQKECKQ